ncbi:MAG TPA: MOP flippase family protein, partial [Polyangiaceae bacterium]|nr:MOP flippase family protein [Polyangiaceae bacterium]
MSLVTQVRHGIAWTTGARACAQVLDFGVGILLARLLQPEDFGLLEMTLVITGFLALFGELGFGAALIQRQEVNEQHASTVFWLNVLTGVALAVILALSAAWIARFYGDPRLAPLTWAVSVNFLISPLNMVQGALLHRAMKFRELAIVDVSAVCVSSATAVTLALHGMGTWSLVGRSLAGGISTTLVLWTLSRWRPRFLFSRAALKELLAFSTNLLGFMTINYWARQLDDLLIGKYMGPAQLGVYGRAYSTMMLPLREISNVLGKVLFPALSRIHADKPRVKTLYLRWLDVIAFISFPIMALLFASADNLIVALYGDKWQPVVPILRIFCVVGAFQSLGTTVGWIYQSQGRTDWMFRWGLIASLLIIGSIVYGVWLGSIRAVATSYAIMTVAVLSYPQFAIPGRLIDMKPLELLLTIWRTAFCAVITAGTVWALGR